MNLCKNLTFVLLLMVGPLAILQGKNPWCRAAADVELGKPNLIFPICNGAKEIKMHKNVHFRKNVVERRNQNRCWESRRAGNGVHAN